MEIVGTIRSGPVFLKKVGKGFKPFGDCHRWRQDEDRLAIHSFLMHLIDLSAYFNRIGYEGSATPTLETLQVLHYLHVITIPFENLNPWTDRRVSLQLEDIESKLVKGKRGGYCFEQNGLFAAILRQIGYQVTPLIARVRWNQPTDNITGRTHMILRVEIDGTPWIADVGFGGVGQTGPLALKEEIVQPTSHEARRYQQTDAGFTHQIQLAPDRWEDVYTFDLHEAFPVDYEMANWFTSTHPDSIFRKSLIVTRPGKDHRLILASGELTRRFPNGRLEKHVITGDEELRRLLVNEFGMPAEDPAVTGCGLQSRLHSMDS